MGIGVIPKIRQNNNKCYNRTQHKALCDVPFTYRAEKVGHVVDSILSDIFSRA